jgi:hypothetical protein
MANRTGLGAFLGKLFLQIKGFQQTPNTSLQGKQRLQQRADKAAAEKPQEQYVGLLEIGHELLITDEIVKRFIGLSKSIGRVVIIDHISTAQNAKIQASAFGIQVNVDMIVAQQMRQAFLQREQRMA